MLASMTANQSSHLRMDHKNLNVHALNDFCDIDSVLCIPHFGVHVCFIPHRFHYTEAELEPYRKIGDPKMDKLLNYLAENKAVGRGCGPFDDVIANAAGAYKNFVLSSRVINTSTSPLVQFYQHYYENVPDWVDFDQIQRGIDMFLAYFPAAACALFYRSLIGGFSIPKIVEVLVATRYLVPSYLDTTIPDDAKIGNSSRCRSIESISRDRKRTVERLLDTGGFLACCFAPRSNHDPSSLSDHNLLSAASLRPGGKGWEAALRVRTLHAKVRRSLLQSKREKSDGQSISLWNVEKNGIPINQEDMAATLLAFSVNVLLGIELIAGKALPETEQRDYLALWRYLGWLLGVDTPETCLDVTRAPSEVQRSSDASLNLRNSSDRNYSAPLDPCGPGRPYQYGCSACAENGKTPLGCLGLETKEMCPDKDPIIYAYATLESIILHLLHPERSSRELVLHLLSVREKAEIPLKTTPLENDKEKRHREIVSSVFFKYRSEICRKFLGDPLSDELGIPKSSIDWRCWRKIPNDLAIHASVKILVYLFLVSFRCYTLLTMTIPCIRKHAILWHASLVMRFLKNWEKNHRARLNTAFTGQKPDTPMSSSDTLCPFSMIMAPKLE